MYTEIIRLSTIAEELNIHLAELDDVATNAANPGDMFRDDSGALHVTAPFAAVIRAQWGGQA